MSGLPFAFTKNGTQYRGVEDYVPQGLGSKTLSSVVGIVSHRPDVVRTTEQKPLTRKKTSEIEEYGIPSCQLTRTYGLIVYALSNFGITIDLEGNIEEMLYTTKIKEILELFYPDISPHRKVPHYVDYISPLSLAYLRFALSFSDLNQISSRMSINFNKIKDHLEYLTYFNEVNPYFDTIHTFAIIKHSPDGELPIHYFNIVKSQSLGVICCYSSWGSDTISVKLNRFEINLDDLINIPKLLDLMIDPENVFFQTTTIPEYKSSLGDFVNLYVIEILNPQGEPLVNTVEKVLSPIAIYFQSGGSIKNKKRKIYNRKSNKKKSRKTKRTKKVRKTYKKR